jgi:hypothetical protein
MAAGSVTHEETTFHHRTHRGLVWSVVGSAAVGRRIDAIVVPTIRPPEFLTEAASLALALDCPLLTFHSGPATSAEMVRDYLPAKVDLIAIDMRPREELSLPELRTCELLGDGIFKRTSDLSTKRNLALVLAHQLGWSRVLYLDDDITELSAGNVDKASGLLDTYNAVGFWIGGYPDNSVVCHAYREAGGKQESFVGGGALAVEVGRCDSFFPDIYNDDWFYLLDGNEGLQPTAIVGDVKQRPYDPFRNPERARAEELGDVLAEGLYWLLDRDGSIAGADQDHWRNFLLWRRSFITSVATMVRDSDLPDADKTRMQASLQASLGRLDHITPAFCESYLQAWLADRARWRAYLDSLPRCEQRSEAIAGLWRSGRPRRKRRAGRPATSSRSRRCFMPG